MLKPRVAHYNSNGIHISLENTGSTFERSCQLVLRRDSNNVRAACKLAAKRLRKMADALDLLADHERPFHEDSAIEAVRSANASQE